MFEPKTLLAATQGFPSTWLRADANISVLWLEMDFGGAVKFELERGEKFGRDSQGACLSRGWKGDWGKVIVAE